MKNAKRRDILRYAFTAMGLTFFSCSRERCSDGQIENQEFDRKFLSTLEGEFPYFFKKVNTKYNYDRHQEFRARAKEIYAKHIEQSKQDVFDLNEKYLKPNIGKFTVYEVLELLGSYQDPTDTFLLGCSQQLHILQMLDQMERDGVIDDDEMFIAAILHDIGKILFKAGEEDHNIVCVNSPILEPSEAEGLKGQGLDNVIFQWNHDEFGYMRMREFVSRRVAWLIRYHSIKTKPSMPYMSEVDKNLFSSFLTPFRHYDFKSKSPLYVPKKQLRHYKSRIDGLFPKKIWF